MCASCFTSHGYGAFTLCQLLSLAYIFHLQLACLRLPVSRVAVYRWYGILSTSYRLRPTALCVVAVEGQFALIFRELPGVMISCEY